MHVVMTEGPRYRHRKVHLQNTLLYHNISKMKNQITMQSLKFIPSTERGGAAFLHRVYLIIIIIR